MTDFSFKFRPNKPGIQAVLGELESQIMNWLWRNGEGTVRDVQNGLNAEPEPAYTTIMTVMSRLAQKGLLTKTKRSHAFLYRPAMTKPQFQKNLMRKVMGSLLDSFGTPALSHFVDAVHDELPEKIDELAELIEAKRQAGHE